MSIWRLEWLRLIRTRRWLVLLGTFAVFGLAGPVTVYYLPQLLSSRLAEMKIVLPPPAPSAGLAEYAETLSGLGLIIVVVVAAGALCLDANPTLAAFYRTRLPSVWSLVGPRFVVTTIAVAASFIVGTAAAWYETVVLLGRVPASAVVGGAVLSVAYLVFVVAVVAFASTVTRSSLATVGLSLCMLFVLPLLAIYEPVGRWAPSTLAGSFGGMLDGKGLGGYWRALASAGVLVPAMLVTARFRLARREL